jgi:hypothetical protein
VLNRVQFSSRRNAQYFGCILSTAIVSIVSMATARADNITFHVANQSGLGVQVEFYSQNFNRSWPGGGQAYIQNDSGTHDYKLNCGPGENICYGAWTMPRHTSWWGRGDDGTKPCSDCCWTCGSNPKLQRLLQSTPAPAPTPRKSYNY